MGLGKSVLLSSIIEQAQTQTNATTAYFFFDHDDPNTNNALGCLKALVKQILEQNMDLTPMAKPYLYGYGSGSFDMYKALLFNILGSIGIVYLVIDGIDECNSEDKGNFLKLLIELQRLNIRTCRVCVSSRMESVIADQLNQEATAIELKGTLIDAPYLFAQRTVSQIFQRRNYGTAIGEAIRDMLDSENEKRE